MDMQDKEFDQIFNSKFEGFEVEPSPMVWSNIADELDGKRSKGIALPWLSIAATIIVMLTAGILFLRKDKPVNNDNKSTKLAASPVKPVVTTTGKQQSGMVATVKSVDKIAVTANHQHKNNLVVNKVVGPTVAKVDVNGNNPLLANTDERQPTSAIPDAISTNIKPALPDVKLMPKNADMVTQTPVERPLVTASAGIEEPEPAKKHGIRSIGGLINVLIAKVDKRQDKLIEFSDSDDDDTESNVTGVNLGVIKIKKQ